MRDQGFYDRVQLAEFALQILTLIWASNDSTNSQLMDELQMQDRVYLETIIDQNNRILKYLSNESD